MFVEELIGHLGPSPSNHDMFERGEQVALDLPHSLRLVIGRRLGLVSRETARILDTAAVIRRSFPFALLEAATHTDPDRLLDSVEEAEGAGLISSKLQYPEARFQFAHELIRRAVLDEVSIARRQRLHLNIAEALELLHPNDLEAYAEDLAYHFWSAGAKQPRRTSAQHSHWRAASARKGMNCVRRRASPACCAIAATATKRARHLPKSTTGSLKASTPLI